MHAFWILKGNIPVTITAKVVRPFFPLVHKLHDTKRLWKLLSVNHLVRWQKTKLVSWEQHFWPKNQNHHFHIYPVLETAEKIMKAAGWYKSWAGERGIYSPRSIPWVEGGILCASVSWSFVCQCDQRSFRTKQQMHWVMGRIGKDPSGNFCWI